MTGRQSTARHVKGNIVHQKETEKKVYTKNSVRAQKKQNQP